MIKKVKSKRTSKQLGDFGEQLVMHILVQYNHKNVAIALVINDSEKIISVYLMTLNVLKKKQNRSLKLPILIIVEIYQLIIMQIQVNKKTNGIFFIEFKRTSMNKLKL